MKALSGFGRNDMFRVIALVSVLAFPLIADAQLGPLKSIKNANDVQSAAPPTIKTPIASRVSCAEEQWPFLSTECLRRSTEVIEPRVVSMKAAPLPDSIALDAPIKRVGVTNSAQIGAPFAKPKKPGQRRIASHRNEQRHSVMPYPANSESSQTFMASW